MEAELRDVSGLNSRDVVLAQAVALLKLLAHPVRLSILCNLMRNDEMTAGDIVRLEDGRASQSQVSQYLAKLRQDGIVSTRREGQTIYYRVRDPQVQTLIESLHDLLCGNPEE